jgi:hypothetical protein
VHAKPNQRGINIKTETLLRYLGRDSKSDKIKLRACELLLILEGKLKQQELPAYKDQALTNSLNHLAKAQSTDSIEYSDREIARQEVAETEKLLAAT